MLNPDKRQKKKDVMKIQSIRERFDFTSKAMIKNISTGPFASQSPHNAAGVTTL